LVAEAMWWVAGSSENKANSAQLELELGLSLAIENTLILNDPYIFKKKH
jgi:hypothetical protein